MHGSQIKRCSFALINAAQLNITLSEPIKAIGQNMKMRDQSTANRSPPPPPCSSVIGQHVNQSELLHGDFLMDAAAAAAAADHRLSPLYCFDMTHLN